MIAIDHVHKIKLREHKNIIKLEYIIRNINNEKGEAFYRFAYGTYIDNNNQEFLIFKMVALKYGTIVRIQESVIDNRFDLAEENFINKIYHHLILNGLEYSLEAKKYINKITHQKEEGDNGNNS